MRNTISRRSFLSSVAVASSLSSRPAQARPVDDVGSGESRLNVLFIVLEDIAPFFNCYGHRQVRTPNIDRLASESTLFQRAYCQQALCSPSRISMFTGIRPETSGIIDNKTPFRSIMPDVVTLPQAFKEAGYETIPVGKVFHIDGDTKDTRSWTVDHFNSSKKYVLESSFDERRRRIEQAEKLGITSFYGMAPVTECADVPDDSYDDGILTEKAIEHLQEHRDKPFFLCVGYHRTHLPFTAPKKYWDLYKREDIQTAADQSPPRNAPEVAYKAPTELRKFLGLPADAPIPEEQQKEAIHAYYACISYVDALIGRLLDTLDRLQLAQKTIVVLTGDHGFHLGEHGLWAKKTIFEGGVRTPLIVKVPSLTRGDKTKSLTEFVDIYPSLCELAGVPVPDQVQGTSSVPVLKDPEVETKDCAFSLYPRYKPGNREDKTIGYSVRSDRYRYNEWVHIPTQTVVAREFYDYEADPNETVNSVEDPGYSAIVRQMAGVLGNQIDPPRFRPGEKGDCSA
jgi:iduronate 2-sulfatase